MKGELEGSPGLWGYHYWVPKRHCRLIGSGNTSVTRVDLTELRIGVMLAIA